MCIVLKSCVAREDSADDADILYCSHFVLIRRYSICCTIVPKYFTCFLTQCTFSNAFSPADVICSAHCYYIVEIYQASCPMQTLEYTSISRQNVAGALQSPIGITLNCHNPQFALNSVCSLSLFAISTCQYPLCRVNVGTTSFRLANRVCRQFSVAGNCPF